MGTTAREPLTGLPAVELAALIARGDASSAEVVEAHIERMERVDPVLNAVVFKRYGEARAEAREADTMRSRGELLGPLHGVPVTIKERTRRRGYALDFRTAVTSENPCRT